MIRPARHQRYPLRDFDQERGIALVAVLCVISLLTVLAVGVLEASRKRGQMLQRSVESAQAREDADSAIRLTILQLSAPKTPTDTQLRELRSIDLFGRTAEVTIERESGRIDLNFADEWLLLAAFAGNGYTDSDARAFANRIMDWRDVDDDTRPEGAERAQYLRVGRANGPRNGPFETVSELRHIPGLENLSEEVADAFTVYSQTAEVSERYAAPAALRALQWAEAVRLAERRWLQQRHSGTADDAEPNTLTGEVLRLRGCATYASFESCRVAVVRLTGNRQRPALVYAWSTRYEWN